MIDIVKIGLLYDFYEKLLTERQRSVLELYLNENLSLTEISEEINITRQGVHDIISRTASKLTEYENKLGLSARLRKKRMLAEDIREMILVNGNEAALAVLDRIIED